MGAQQRIRVPDALEMFLLDCEARRFTAHTLRFYRGRLKLFVEWCAEQDSPGLGELTPTHLRRFLVELSRRNLSSAYVHSHARALRAFLNYCVRDGLIESSPFARVQMPRLEKKILPALTSAEVQRIVAACETERDRALVLFLLDSGVRASELCALDEGDVDLSTGAVQVRSGKGQKDRMTYIGASTRKQVVRYLKLERPGDGPALFVSHKVGRTGRPVGERLTYSGVAQMFKRLRRATQVRHCCPHAMRRTFAINCLRGGMNIYVLARLMGHADITVLRHYLELVQDDLQNAHQQAAVVDKLLSDRRGRKQ
jgi:site-specific recombinase XerD